MIFLWVLSGRTWSWSAMRISFGFGHYLSSSFPRDGGVHLFHIACAFVVVEELAQAELVVGVVDGGVAALLLIFQGYEVTASVGGWQRWSTRSELRFENITGFKRLVIECSSSLYLLRGQGVQIYLLVTRPGRKDGLRQHALSI